MPNHWKHPFDGLHNFLGIMEAKSQALQTLLTMHVLIAQYGIVFSHGSSIHCLPGPCGPGFHRIEDSLDCDPCPQDTYMPRNNHSCISCQICTKPGNYDNKIVIKNCTATSDTEIGCKSGYHLEGGSHYLRCKRCIVCRGNEVETSPCVGRSKRVCSSVKLPSSVSDASTTPLPISTENRGESGMRFQIPTSETTAVDLDRRNVAPTEDTGQFKNENFNVELIIGCAVGGLIIIAALCVTFVCYIRTRRRGLAGPESAPQNIELRNTATPLFSSHDDGDLFSN
ncbi:hypothetical protein BsWGS_25756 [Bradybaena similaris]